MRRLYYASFGWMVLGVSSGLFYREFTKSHDFTEGATTQLAVVHTHTLTLGFIVLLLVLVLERLFRLSRSALFGWFFWIYNAGLLLTVSMMVWHGSLTVMGRESTAMIAGIAGMGHILVTVGMVLLFLCLGRAITRDEARTRRLAAASGSASPAVSPGSTAGSVTAPDATTPASV